MHRRVGRRVEERGEQAVDLGARQLLGVVGVGGERHRPRCGVAAHSSVIRTSPGSLCRSMTRQSPHICSRSAARPWNIEWPDELGDHRLDRAQRAERLGAAHAAERLGFVEDARLPARLAAVGEEKARHERDRVLRAGARAQAALDAVLLDEAEARRVGMVDAARLPGRRRRTPGTSVQVLLSTTIAPNGLGAPAGAGSAIDVGRRRRLAQQVLEGEVERRPLVGLDGEGRGATNRRRRRPAQRSVEAQQRRIAGRASRAPTPRARGRAGRDAAPRARSERDTSPAPTMRKCSPAKPRPVRIACATFICASIASRYAGASSCVTSTQTCAAP